MEKYKVLSAVFNITPENTFVKSTDFIYIAASESFAKSIGKMSAEEVVGKTDYELFDDIFFSQIVNMSIYENIKGIGIIEDTKRYYPYNNLAAYVIGFCNSDNQGLLSYPCIKLLPYFL